MNEDRIIDIILVVGYLSIIILRLFNVITWEWLWIFAPFWIAAIIAGISFIITIIIYIIIIIHDKRRVK